MEEVLTAVSLEINQTVMKLSNIKQYHSQLQTWTTK